MSTAFCSPDFLDRETKAPISVPSKTVNVHLVYEIDRCLEWITTGSYVNVAIQLPDELLCDSVAIVEKLEKSSAAKVFVLGDTSYGSCCVDEVAAQHISADAVIHFGHACLSPTDRLPVLYVFGQRPVDENDCILKFEELFPDKQSKVVIMYDTSYAYVIGDIYKSLHESYKCVILSELDIPDFKGDRKSESQERTKNVFSRCNRISSLPPLDLIENYSIFYLGSESITLRNLMMNYNKCTFHTYDADTGTARRETLNVNKSLMKRYYMIERVKDADIIGIVAGTLGVTDYLQVIERMKKLVKNSGKKSYTFVVGKLNVEKLANFMEIDVFVLVSCPENTLIDSSEFYKPVVTPFEVEVALNRQREWTGDYITDFQELLPGAANFVDIPSDQDNSAETYVSLFSERVRTLGIEDRGGDTGTGTSSALASREGSTAVSTVKAQSASEFLHSRSWQGLEQNLGGTPVTKATEGRKGIAASYEHEAEQS